MSGSMTDSDSNRGNAALKALREKAGLNRQEMAKAVGVDPRMWQRYENEGRLPSKVEVVIKIAVLSQTPIEDVIRLIGFDLPNREELLLKLKEQGGE